MIDENHDSGERAPHLGWPSEPRDGEPRDGETLYVPGVIQPFGALIAIEPGTHEVVAADEGCAELFGAGPSALLGRRYGDVLAPRLAELVRRVGDLPEPAEERHLVLRSDAASTLHAHVHRWDGRVLCELIPSGVAAPLLDRVARADERIQSAPAESLWQLACDEIASLTGCDRVIGHRVQPSGRPLAVAEALRGAVSSMAGMPPGPPMDEPSHAPPLAARSLSHCCPDLKHQPRPLRCRPGTRPVDLSLARLRSPRPHPVLSPRDLGLVGAASYAVMVDGELRGLLVAHDLFPAARTHEEHVACRMVAQALGYALEDHELRRDADRRLSASEAYGELIHEVVGWCSVHPPGSRAFRLLCQIFDADGAVVQLGTARFCSDDTVADWAEERAEGLAHRAREGPYVCIERVLDSRSPGRPASVVVIAPETDVVLRFFAYRLARPGAVRAVDAAPTAERFVERPGTEGEAAAWSTLELEFARRLHGDLGEAIGPLIDARHLLHRVTESAPMGILLCDAAGRIVSHNVTARALLGEDLAGAALGERLEGWRPEDRLLPEVTLAHDHGHPIPVRVRTSSLAMGEVAWVVFLDDLRDIRKLEGRLAEAKRMESASRLASGLAHDFNNTLSVIVTQASLLREEWPGGVEGSDLLDDLMEASSQGRHIAHQMLAFARTPGEVDAGPSSLSAALRESDRMLHALVEEAARLHLTISDEPLQVPLSRGHIQQIVFNLLGNAKDATHANVWLRAVAKPGDRVLLEVRDDGDGFAPGLLERVFEPFFTTKARSRGTGLGLYVVAGLVRNAGGHITARNDGGAVVEIDLPLVLAPEDDGGRQSSPYFVGPPGPKRVLLVEDNALVRRGLRRVLERAGYSVDECDNGADALAQFERAPPDVLMTDLSMQGMSGLELIRAIMHTGTPCLMLTGHGSPELSQITTPIEVLTKPAMPSHIRKAIARLVLG